MNCHGDKSKTDPNQKQGISKWLYLCGLAALGIIIAVNVFKLSLSSVLYYGFFLLCPLMHILMTKDHGSKNDHHK